MKLRISDGEVPFLSVIMPAFNRAHLIARAIESVRAQTFQNWELLIVDDGSRDDTFDVIQPYAIDDARIRYHYATNRGLAMARNIGIGMSVGAYITFLDTDDEYLPEHLERRFEVLTKNPAIELLHGGVEVVGDDMVADKFDPSKLVPISECVVGGTFVIRRSLVDALNGFADVEYGDDGDFFERAKTQGANIAKIDTPTYRYYRTEPDSLCAIAERGGIEAIRAFRKA